MPARAERRAHHVAGGGLPVGVLVDAVVQQQVASEDFAIHRLALAARIGDLIQRFFGRHVHQVQRRADSLGDADRAAGRFTFNLGWARQRCASGPVMPWAISLRCRWYTSSPFSACTVGTAPNSRQRSKLATRVSSAAMIAFCRP